MARGIGLGLLAAALFGASIPVTKLLAADADPLVLAGLLYLGAGAALALVRLLRPGAEAKLCRSDAPWLLGIVGAAALAVAPGALRLDGLGAAALVCACAAWALDTNLTQRVSLRDPVTLVRFKTLAGGACTFFLALALGGKLPGARQTA